MVKKEIEILSWIFYVVAVVLIFWMIILLIRKLTGHSPTEMTFIMGGMGIIAALLVLVITSLFRIEGKMGEFSEFKRQISEFKKQTIEKIKEIEEKGGKK